MTFGQLDDVKTAAAIAAFLFFNWRAFYVVIMFAMSDYIFDSLDTGLSVCAATSVLYALTALNITLSSEVRKAILCLAVITWLSAVDYWLFPYETLFFVCYPWLVNGLDVYILYHLLHTGGRQDVGLAGYIAASWRQWRYSLQLRQTIPEAREK